VITTATCPAAALLRDLEALHESSTAVLVRDLPAEDERFRSLLMESAAALIGPPRCYPMSRYGPGPVHELTEAAPSLAAGGLDWHTEDSFAPAPPAFVALLCVQGDEQVRTRLRRLAGPEPDSAAEGMTRPDPYLRGEGQAASRPLAFAGRRGTGWRYDPALIIPDASSPDRCPRLDRAEDDEFLVLAAGDLLVFEHSSASRRACRSRPGAGSSSRALTSSAIPGGWTGPNSRRWTPSARPPATGRRRTHACSSRSGTDTTSCSSGTTTSTRCTSSARAEPSAGDQQT